MTEEEVLEIIEIARIKKIITIEARDYLVDEIKNIQKNKNYEQHIDASKYKTPKYKFNW